MERRTFEIVVQKMVKLACVVGCVGDHHAVRMIPLLGLDAKGIGHLRREGDVRWG